MNVQNVCLALFLVVAVGCATGTGSSTGEGGDPITTDPGTLVGGGGDGGGGAFGGTGGTTTTSTSSSQLNLSQLCSDTWGTSTSKQCCLDEGQWPDTCSKTPHCGDIITCQGDIEPETSYCECPQGQCFDRVLGCIAG